jgi:uncharacterized protein YbjT (DUF2867 family)
MNDQRCTTLITGATGTIGRQLVAALAERGVPLRATSREPGVAAWPTRVERARFDYTDEATFEPALEGIERLFLLSPTGFVDSAGLTARFLDVALPRVAKVVLLTAQGVDASEAIPHRRLERRIEQSGVEYVILRPTWYSDNFHTFWRSNIVKRGEISLPAADSKTAFIDARDVAACAVEALVRADHAGHTYVLTGPAALSYHEAAAILGEASEREIRYVDLREEDFERDAIREGMPPDYARLVVGLLAGVRAGVTAEVRDDVRRLTGAAPRTLYEYAAHHAAEWRLQA